MKEAEEVEVNGVKEVEAVSMNFFFFFNHSVSLSHESDVANIYWLA